MPDIALSRYSFRGRNWVTITPEVAHDVARIANQDLLQGTFPQRFGLKNCRITTEPDLAIVGHVVHEYERPQVRLTQDKMEQTVPSEDAERFVFAALLNAGLVSFQRKRVRYLPNRQLMEDHFQVALGRALSSAGLEFGGLEPVDYGPTREEFLYLFASAPDTARVTYVHFGALSRALPADFKFFNPKEDWDAVMRDVIEITRQHVNSMSYVASASGDVRKVPEVRGGVQMADRIFALERITTSGEVESYSSDIATTLSVTDQALVSEIPEMDTYEIVRATKQNRTTRVARRMSRGRSARVRQPNSGYVQRSLLDGTD